ncbi:MAG: C39 family peptidase [Candidatus Sungbacteria bacterium]|nr:C39 family peptidase [Candidatus Sungbacteria bacterium]
MSTIKQIKYVVIVGLAVLVGAGAFVFWRHDISRQVERASLPEEMHYAEAVQQTPTVQTAASASVATPPSTSEEPPVNPAVLPAEVNLAVPFVVQAPYARWEDPYGEFCEEASVLMAISYIRGEKIASPADADAKMLAIKAFEDKRFGYYKDTNAAETAAIVKEFYKYANVELVQNPTVADIKKALATGKLVITPLAGRMLGNPYFTAPGPLYHMLVIKGYTKDGTFITNDPGTRRGADFLYSEATVMNALHDWPGNDHIEQGKKTIIIVG